MMTDRNTTIAIGIVLVLVLVLATAFVIPGQHGGEEKERIVVVYTSVDQVYSEPVFRAFENESGIRVLPAYDVEATKTTGLVNRLIAEKTRPQADVFWSGEFSQTIVLKNENVLAPYRSLSASDIPARFRDAEDTWTGFGGRARIFIVNTDLLSPDRYPDSVYDLLDEQYPGPSIGIAYPIFGTTATHAAALYSYLGKERAHDLFAAASKRNIRVVDGNSVVRDLVADGQMAFGLTDTDDACGAVESGKNVTIIIPDQKEDQMGTLVIPNTVALIRGAPHPAEAKIFMDYLLDRKRESALVDSGWIQIPVRDIPPSPCVNVTGIKTIPLPYEDTFNALQPAQKDLTEIFIR
ncbi:MULTISPECIES: extracellular solute-binding protein [unclassified Methanoregula]|uniref:extracellular solute-binding protein n=1 Tax=unclassified Methanoregula TaxID=2649730 RepID=UPI0009D54BE4|nr:MULTISPECIES: extracellular solute-binding protein [unclassified Methanoregula]OPX63051.1 MAG: Bacterial extracellular solute-binding protein [Methanoregula sp. PtaB.Bin085]OPY32326.1 MAG: Bacterial extracellular solute-binding protein [Methanoregula sp. PtaU1.Bin006]